MNQKSLLLFLRVVVSTIALTTAANAWGAAGDLYITDVMGNGSSSIVKITPAGNKTIFATGLSGARGLAFDVSGNLYEADSVTGNIFKFTPAGVKTTFVSGLGSPDALAFDHAGNLFVTDFGTDKILKITPVGAISTFASGLNSPFFAIAFDTFGNLFLAGSFEDKIFKFTPNGTKSVFASVFGPLGLAFDQSGNLLVASFNSQVFKFTPAGVQTTFATGFGQPTGLAFDVAGNLFVGDGINGTITKITPAGTKTVFASGLSGPNYLAFEPVTEKLRSISARGFVQTGENVLIAGFILGGNQLNNNAVVIRAIGPSLSQFGIANPLLDPTLELHNQNGAIIASNDNWQTTQSTQLVGTGLAPIDSHESAIFAILGAGSYTAVVRGAGANIGVAVVEIYSIR